MPKADEGVGIVGLHLQDAEIDGLGLAEVAHLAVRIGDAREHRNVFIIVKKVLFPYLDRLLVLIQRLIAIGEAEKGVIVPGMVDEAFLIMVHRLAEGAALAGGVAEADEGVVVLPIPFEDASEAFFGFLDAVFLEILIALLGEIGDLGKLLVGGIVLGIFVEGFGSVIVAHFISSFSCNKY
jgi:hypothetical protein